MLSAVRVQGMAPTKIKSIKNNILLDTRKSSRASFYSYCTSNKRAREPRAVPENVAIYTASHSEKFKILCSSDIRNSVR